MLYWILVQSHTYVNTLTSLSFQIICNICGILVKRTMSSAKRRMNRYLPFCLLVLRLVSSQLSFLKTVSSTQLNRFENKESPCFTPRLISKCFPGISTLYFERKYFQKFLLYIYVLSIPGIETLVRVDGLCYQKLSVSR